MKMNTGSRASKPGQVGWSNEEDWDYGQGSKERKWPAWATGSGE